MGAFLLGCLPPLPLAYFAAPIPPSPFPAGRGRLRLFYARGFAPCIPGAGWDAALGLLAESGLWRGLLFLPPADSALQVPSGGLPSLSPADAAFSLLSRPHPPNPLPGGKGEIFSFLMQGALPLASPGLGGTRHWGCLWKAGYGGGLARAALGHGGRSCVRRGACLLGCLPTLPLACFLAPIPPTPFPGGEGGDF